MIQHNKKINYRILQKAHCILENLYNELLYMNWNREDRTRLQQGFNNSVKALISFNKGHGVIPIENVKNAVAHFGLIIIGVIERNTRWYSLMNSSLRQIILPCFEYCIVSKVIHDFKTSGLCNISGRIHRGIISLQCLERERIFHYGDNKISLTPTYFPSIRLTGKGDFSFYKPMTTINRFYQNPKDAALLRDIEQIPTDVKILTPRSSSSSVNDDEETQHRNIVSSPSKVVQDFGHTSQFEINVNCKTGSNNNLLPLLDTHVPFESKETLRRKNCFSKGTPLTDTLKSTSDHSDYNSSANHENDDSSSSSSSTSDDDLWLKYNGGTEGSSISFRKKHNKIILQMYPSSTIYEIKPHGLLNTISSHSHYLTQLKFSKKIMEAYPQDFINNLKSQQQFFL